MSSHTYPTGTGANTVLQERERNHKTLKNKTPTVQLDYSYLKQGPDEKLIKVKSNDVTKEEAETLVNCTDSN